MADKWLESRLAKVTPIPERVEVKSSDPLFAAIYDRPGDEPIEDVSATDMVKIYDDGNAAIFEPVGAFLEKKQNDRFENPPRWVWRGIPETGDVIFVETALGKLIGINLEDQHPQEL